MMQDQKSRKAKTENEYKEKDERMKSSVRKDKRKWIKSVA